MTPVAPRIVNSVSYVTRINDESHFAWQAQYLGGPPDWRRFWLAVLGAKRESVM